MRGNGTKLGEWERDFAQMSFAQMSLRANVASRKCHSTIITAVKSYITLRRGVMFKFFLQSLFWIECLIEKAGRSSMFDLFK